MMLRPLCIYIFQVKREERTQGSNRGEVNTYDDKTTNLLVDNEKLLMLHNHLCFNKVLFDHCQHDENVLQSRYEFGNRESK